MEGLIMMSELSERECKYLESIVAFKRQYIEDQVTDRMKDFDRAVSRMMSLNLSCDFNELRLRYMEVIRELLKNDFDMGLL
jgi:hypothetical protein